MTPPFAATHADPYAAAQRATLRGNDVYPRNIIAACCRHAMLPLRSRCFVAAAAREK